MAESFVCAGAMQSSVRAETARVADLKGLSSTSVRVNRKVTVVSSTSPTPVVKRGKYSHMPSVPNDHSRPQTSPSPANVTAVDAPLHRWNSTRTSNTNRPSLRHSRARSQQAPQDVATLDDSRQHMRALSDFLMTRQPPPNNWVSKLSDDERSLNSLKKSAFKLFKNKSKSQKAPRLLQLPDSAVAAKTLSGVRHIAISIPIEHDHIEPPKKPAPLVQARPQQLQQSLSANSKPDRPAVTILKPVVELRESVSSHLSSIAKNMKSKTELSSPSPEPRAKSSELHVDTTKISRDYYTGLETRQITLTDDSRSANGEEARSPKSYKEISPVLRQDSLQSDPRHSGGTAYSTVTLGTWGGHSRGPSSVSTAPSASPISPHKFDLPPRNSSKVRVPQNIAELIQPSKLVTEVPQDGDPLHPAAYRASETTPHTISTSSPAIIAAEGEIVHRHSASGDGEPQITRSFTPEGVSPTPAKKLPDQSLPQDFSRPKTAPPSQARKTAMAQLKEADPRPRSSGMDESLRATRQSRLERVKARKQRDIEILRSKAGTRAPLSPTLSANNTQAVASLGITSPPKKLKRGLNVQTQNLAKRKDVNVISPIMLVADLTPSTELVAPGDLAAPRTPRKDKNSGPSTTVRSAEHTPPQSLLSFSPSDTEHARNPRRALSGDRDGTKAESRIVSLSGSSLENRRRERRMKRNTRERERELDVRVTRIERDNESPTGLMSVERSMRQLQTLAPRVSRESIKPIGDEFEEDDGGSILL
ncbi:hypothetical protein NA56DRAFT_147522 [Hyaloscypha hepaticicola]|uniref:Uncharacterized protein n=1 Tax=Hyaloscypha hepaticicola TaxID=2082293 RepID=A0A2J6QNF0_9HELO|nr:hypothetical protein NA56DRAFT_147522 [Hyaloscypha hepaticicola]